MNPNNLGSTSEISGTYVQINRTIIIAAKNGRMCRITLVTVVCAIPQPRKRHVPTGGVHRPMHRFIIMIMPKWRGSIPRLLTTGRKIGVKIKTAGVISIKVPTARRMRFIISSIITLLAVSPSRKALMFCGMFW